MTVESLSSEQYSPTFPIKDDTSNTAQVIAEPQWWRTWYDRAHQEAGVRRIDVQHRQEHPRPRMTDVVKFWAGCNFTVFNMIVGLLGPLQFRLRLPEAAIIATTAIVVGSCAVGLVTCLGPKSGLRTTIIARFFVGWYPAKAVSFINFIMGMGYAVLEIITAGNIVTRVTHGDTEASIGAVVGLGSLAVIVAVAGSATIHFVEVASCLPQVLLICILLGSVVPLLEARGSPAMPKDDMGSSLGHRWQFFGLVLLAIITFSGIAADFFNHYPEDMPTYQMVAGTFLGIAPSSGCTVVIGVVVGTAAYDMPPWLDAYEHSPAAVFVAAFKELGGLGTLCSILLALGSLSGATISIYSQVFSLQSLNRKLASIPRVIATGATGTVVIICAAFGRNSLEVYLQSFISMVGDSIGILLTICLLEPVVSRRMRYDWARWDEKSSMPWGLAASVAFLVGYPLSVLAMVQPWVTGPIARLIDPNGLDISSIVGPAAAAASFPVLRLIEIRLVK